MALAIDHSSSSVAKLHHICVDTYLRSVLVQLVESCSLTRPTICTIPKTNSCFVSSSPSFRHCITTTRTPNMCTTNTFQSPQNLISPSTTSLQNSNPIFRVHTLYPHQAFTKHAVTTHHFPPTAVYAIHAIPTCPVPTTVSTFKNYINPHPALHYLPCHPHRRKENTHTRSQSPPSRPQSNRHTTKLT